MNTNKLSGAKLYQLLLGGYQNLNANKDYIDALNVFPVPDGDTGKNMVATLTKAVDGVKDINNVTLVAQNFAKLSLFSARGNSGVILSQFFNGISKYLLDNGKPETISLSTFALALNNGYSQALTSVLRPVEGTILTVLRESTSFVVSYAKEVENINDFFNILVEQTKKSLENTPNLLPVLKDAGVVDAGGAGVLCIFEGMQAVANGKEIQSIEPIVKQDKESVGAEKLPTKDYQMSYGYCTEFILQILQGENRLDFRKDSLVNFLHSIGNSIVAVQDEDIVKVHVHTFTPEKVLEFARQYGELLTIKIENMDMQNSVVKEHTHKPTKKHIKNAIVAVCNGEGICNYFTEIGADYIINAGQTQNPSTQDFINAFKQLNAENIIVLPNNKNIILAARQAKELYKDANVLVLETLSIAEGYSALSMIDSTAQNADELLLSMKKNLKNVTTALVAKANKNTVINNVDIVEGDFLSVVDGEIKACNKNKNDAVLSALQNIDAIDEKETIVVFVGADVSDLEKENLRESLEDAYPLYDVALIDGNQPVYSYILSVE